MNVYALLLTALIVMTITSTIVVIACAIRVLLAHGRAKRYELGELKAGIAMLLICVSGWIGVFEK